MESSNEYYDILGVDPEASTGEIRSAYKRLALSAHPDRGGDASVFARISKAYEVLSDAKARDRYDRTGRTSALSPEEEFIEGMRGGFSSTADKYERRQDTRARRPDGAADAEAQRREAERQEAQRRLDEAERRDAERRRRLQGDAGAPPARAAPPSGGYGSSSSAPGVALALGTRIRVVGLTTRPELNGATGVIVDQDGDRWQVKMDADGTEKKLRAANLSACGPATNGGATAPRSAATPAGRPTPHLVASWANWAPLPMGWDSDRECFCFVAEMREAAMLSFQVLLDGDWSRCLYPDRAHANPHERHEVCGPDDKGHGKNWTIGRNPADQPAVGARYEIRVFLNTDGTAKHVDWTKVSQDTSKEGAVANASKADGLTSATLAQFLASAFGDRNDKERGQILVKLANVDVRSVPELQAALDATGVGALNARLRAAGEKAFGQDALLAMRSLVRSLAQPRSNGKNGVHGAHAPAQPQARAAGMPQVVEEPPLPQQRYRVVHDFVYVRDRPLRTGQAIGQKLRNQELAVVEETFDGWVRLDREAGWVLKDMKGQQGLGKLLATVGGEPQGLAVTELADAPGPHRFTVVFTSKIAIRVGPGKEYAVRDTAREGETLLVESQTYHGWLRLADGRGWVLSRDPQLGALVAPAYVQEQQAKGAAKAAAEEALRQALGSTSADALKTAILRARTAGATGELLQAAEGALSQLRQRDEARRQARQLIVEASGYEAALAALVSDCIEADFHEEAALAQKSLDQVLEEQSREAQQHADVLDKFADSVRRGDREEIRCARDACKRAGVPVKEIGRVFALAQAEAAAAEAAPPPAPPAPREERPAEPPAEPLAEAAPPATEEAALPEVRAAEAPRGEPQGASNGGALLGPEVLDGVWHTESGDYAATIRGAAISWADGPTLELGIASAGVSCMLGDEVVEAEVDAQGRLVWNDGEIWVRSEAAAAEAAAAEAAGGGAEDAPPSTSARGDEVAAEPARAAPSAFDGRWQNAQGELMASILGTAIDWQDGPVQELSVVAAGKVSFEMGGEVFVGELDGEGKLLWSDGDVWLRCSDDGDADELTAAGA